MMRHRERTNNILKSNLLIQMRGRLITEAPPWHDTMGDPVVAKKAQHGYLEGDDPELMGKEVWFHTNRHNIKFNKNGAFGYMVDPLEVEKMLLGGAIGYTNDILLGGIVNFDISPGYHNVMRTTRDAGDMEKRSQVVGVGGVVQALPEDPVEFKRCW